MNSAGMAAKGTGSPAAHWPAPPGLRRSTRLVTTQPAQTSSTATTIASSTASEWMPSMVMRLSNPSPLLTAISNRPMIRVLPQVEHLPRRPNWPPRVTSPPSPGPRQLGDRSGSPPLPANHSGDPHCRSRRSRGADQPAVASLSRRSRIPRWAFHGPTARSRVAARDAYTCAMWSRS